MVPVGTWRDEPNHILPTRTNRKITFGDSTYDFMIKATEYLK